MQVDAPRRRLVQQLARGIDAAGRVGANEAKAEVAAFVQRVEQQNEGQQALDLFRPDVRACRIAPPAALAGPVVVDLAKLGLHDDVGRESGCHGRSLSVLFVAGRSEEHTSLLPSLMRISYAV